jgi:hypothetical protein
MLSLIVQKSQQAMREERERERERESKQGTEARRRQGWKDEDIRLNGHSICTSYTCSSICLSVSVVVVVVVCGSRPSSSNAFDEAYDTLNSIPPPSSPH